MLFPCPACARHVRLGEASCPFCGGPSPSPSTLPAGFGRAARAVAPLLAAGLLAGCEETPPPTSAASASTPSAGPSATTAVASAPATTTTAPPTASATASATSVPVQGSASASNAHPPATGTATATATTTTTAKPLWVPPPNVKKPYGAPPADGWPFEA